MSVLAATDFFTTEVWTRGGLVTYYILFFMHVATRRINRVLAHIANAIAIEIFLAGVGGRRAVVHGIREAVSA